MALSELPIALAKYFNEYSNPTRCFKTFRCLVSLLDTDKPCGVNGDCYSNTLDINSNPITNLSDDEGGVEKNSAWQDLDDNIKEI